MVQPQADQQFDVDISSRRELHELQRLEQTHGQKVHDWVDEGIPREAMGTPEKMRAFRKRKPTPVPWNAEGKNEQSVQRSTEAAADTSPAGETGVPDSVREVISSSGQSLDGTIQRTMEAELGGSFGDVQIHTGPSAATACESINARAFTVGNHVAFNHGEYNPSSPEGQHVIAHELAHVRQQTGGAVSLLPQDGVELEVDPDPQLEREAEATAQRVAEGQALGIQRLGTTDVHVQRLSPPNQHPNQFDFQAQQWIQEWQTRQPLLENQTQLLQQQEAYLTEQQLQQRLLQDGIQNLQAQMSVSQPLDPNQAPVDVLESRLEQLQEDIQEQTVAVDQARIDLQSLHDWQLPPVDEIGGEIELQQEMMNDNRRALGELRRNRERLRMPE